MVTVPRQVRLVPVPTESTVLYHCTSSKRMSKYIAALDRYIPAQEMLRVPSSVCGASHYTYGAQFWEKSSPELAGWGVKAQAYSKLSINQNRLFSSFSNFSGTGCSEYSQRLDVGLDPNYSATKWRSLNFFK